MSSFISSIKSHIPATRAATDPDSNPLASLPTPPTLPPQSRLLVALACTCAWRNNKNYSFIPPNERAEWDKAGERWVGSILGVLQMEKDRLPNQLKEEEVRRAGRDWLEGMDDKEKEKEWQDVAKVLLICSVFTPPTEEEKAKPKEDGTNTLGYSPASRLLTYQTLSLLSIPPHLVPETELPLSRSLFQTLQNLSSSEQIASAQKGQSEGYGGRAGRLLATGAGVIAGGLAIGLTGGLAAPAILALVPGFMSFGLLSAASAPIVLGGVFGVTAGGLTGRRVERRWRGVGEFGFVDVKVGSERVEPALPDPEENEEEEKGAGSEGEKTIGDVLQAEKDVTAGQGDRENPVHESSTPLESAVDEVQEKTNRISLDDPIEHEKKKEDEKKLLAGRPPSLVATIIVPGLLLHTKTEALESYQNQIIPHSPFFQDGRDVYVLNYETEHMLATGKAINSWVTGKLKGYLKKQVIKRTALNAYFAAIALPMSVYSMATMSTDNVWIQSQDKAIKAGRLLGQVLEKRVQGQRPVVLIGHSLGALTVFHALLYLSSSSSTNLPEIVDSAFLISLPSAPTEREWSNCRRVVARRLVNAWSGKDFVLASVVRLHEIVTRAVTLSNGVHVAGLRRVEQPGVEDVDLSEVLEGHLDIQDKMGKILEVIDIDA